MAYIKACIHSSLHRGASIVSEEVREPSRRESSSAKLSSHLPKIAVLDILELVLEEPTLRRSSRKLVLERVVRYIRTFFEKIRKCVLSYVKWWH